MDQNMVCPPTGRQQDELTGALIGLARTCFNNPKTEHTDSLITEGLLATITNVNLNDDTIRELTDRVNEEKAVIAPGCAACMARCGNTDNYDMNRLWGADQDIRSLKAQILFAIQEISANVCQSMDFLYKALFVLAEDWDRELLEPVAAEAEKMKAGLEGVPEGMPEEDLKELVTPGI